ncbi:MAG: Co2+/Mg2+ efflux protein ApaG [Flavobacteriales bacterium]|nr:Co2+/Mg2+ efflux protein ApaG [Flavobacteriales bacterium]
MGTATTNGILISAESRFEGAHSDPKAGRFLFSYRIRIANHSSETVQLLRRHWIIKDSLAPVREVEGPGVVGELPVLAPGEEFSYSSACDLRSGLGRMDGTYLMQRANSKERFRVTIPTVHLIYPLAAN